MATWLCLHIAHAKHAIVHKHDFFSRKMNINDPVEFFLFHFILKINRAFLLFSYFYFFIVLSSFCELGPRVIMGSGTFERENTFLSFTEDPSAKHWKSIVFLVNFRLCVILDFVKIVKGSMTIQMTWTTYKIKGSRLPISVLISLAKWYLEFSFKIDFTKQELNQLFY